MLGIDTNFTVWFDFNSQACDSNKYWLIWIYISGTIHGKFLKEKISTNAVNYSGSQLVLGYFTIIGYLILTDLQKLKYTPLKKKKVIIKIINTNFIII